jgi:predicted dehydrogenase
MADQFNLGLVGAGAISQSYVKGIEGTDVGQWVGVVDAHPEAAEAASKEMGCPVYASPEELADKAGCDGVIICTPPSTHYDIAGMFIDRGIPVICEKPLCIDLASAQALKDAADRKGTVATMASKFRCVDDIGRAKQMIEAGEIGDVLLVENAFTATVDMSQRWNAQPAISGGGVLMDNGTHSVDIIRYLVGPIASVLAVEGKRTQSPAVEDTASLSLKTEKGIIASADLSWQLNKELDTFVKIFGSKGMIFIGWGASKIKKTGETEWTVFGKGYDKFAAFRRQVANFRNHLEGKEPLIITLEDGVASVAVIRAAYDSLKSGTWVPVGSTSASSAAAA